MADLKKDEHISSGKGMSLKRMISALGPAWIISAVAAGPGTTLSVAKAGGTYGYDFLWVVVLSVVLAFVCQYMAAKTALIGGRGIVSIVQDKWGTLPAWFVTLDALAVIWLCNVVLLKVLVAVTEYVSGLVMPWWGVVFTVAFYILVAHGGYRIVEMLCKIIVSLLVVCFIGTLFIAKPDLGMAIHGLLPDFSHFGKAEILMMTAIMGGSIHVTILSMQTYTVHEKGWGVSDLGKARFDTAVSLLGAFGLYCTAIYLTGACVLHPADIHVNTLFEMADAITPLLGSYAHAFFCLGIWCAVFSTIMPTFIAAAYVLGDKMNWEMRPKSPRYRLTILAGCLIALPGAFLSGRPVNLLLIMLALSFLGTPFFVGIFLWLLNDRNWAKQYRNGPVLNIAGGFALLVTLFLGIKWVGGL
ncbi:Nramp family divalent metal transporter [Desulfobacter postgatei]|jgi:manganese transport protein|uniref:Nramp family divalent metal transporter n=1 Tax=Desulfobacter postgatei TaxID=2293 RepID=UPI002A36288A|nr:Nramp family divalent metal transporter [Desulfobacter postgatei]MDX9963393.1 Nramp family divalent metal transporter [Desulfobacter postgatei]